jgi:general secretion pathway protein D
MTRPLTSRCLTPPCAKVASVALCATLLAAALPCPAPAQSDLAAQEVQRRQAVVAAQEARITEATTLLQDAKTQEALVLFEETFLALPDVPMAREVRQRALHGYVTAGINRANELAAKGDLAGANALLDKLDAVGVAPGDKRVARARERLADPDRFPRALTSTHVNRVEEVQRLLVLANSHREIGRYDQALATYEDVLRLDPYNSAARRGMERTEQERMRYFQAARDHQRSRMFSDVDQAWEHQVPRADISSLFGSSPAASPVARRGGRDEIQRKLREFIIDRVDFSGATVEEVLEFLRIRSRDLDPDRRGIDFVMSVPGDAASRSVTLNLNRVPVEEVLRYITELGGMRYRVEEFAVRIVPASDAAGDLITKSYRVPPDFISNAAVDAAPNAPADPFAQTTAPAGGGGLNMRRLGAKEFLETRGVTFPEGASANYSSSASTLIVRNTPRNLDLVDMLVEQALGAGIKQVVIEVKALDVSAEKLKELGFDWLLGEFSLKAGEVIGAGGVLGNMAQPNFPFQFPFQAGGTAVGANPITGGLRSSGDLGSQGIEDVLYGSVSPASRRSPGVFSMAGVLTNPQFQVVLRALDQKTGLDLVAKPSVVTKSGQRASVQVVREMLYPTEFDPPQVPTNFGPTNVIVIGPGAPPISMPPPIVTPATPTAFEMRRIGVVLEVEPVIADDGRSVDLTLTPEITDFVGFVNYGSPIVGFYGDSPAVELTENRIFQPIFSTRKIATSVKVWDGATVVLGGLISDNNIVIQDKVPFLGDAPYVGRLFRSEVKRRRMKNMLIFVTARVIDPSGSRIHPESQ